MAARSWFVRHLFPRAAQTVLSCIFLFFVGLELPALATVWNVKTNCGAIANGTTDDTSAINTCIGNLMAGDTLLFPSGTYKTSSQLNVVGLSNITIDGSNNAATIKSTQGGTSGTMVVGSTSFAGSFGAPIALSATATELSNSITVVSSPGMKAGDFFYIGEGGYGNSKNGYNLGTCDAIGCRGEVLKVASVSGNTITVTTALHDTYVPTPGGTISTSTNNCSVVSSAGNCASIQKILNPVTGLTVQNITFDAQGLTGYALEMNGVMDSTVTGVTAKNAVFVPALGGANFNLAWNNVTITGGGNTGTPGYSAMILSRQGHPSINGLSVSGMPTGANDAFGPELTGVADGTFTDITVDATGATGRAFKLGSTRYSTFDSLTIRDSPVPNNGISLEFYSSHNNFNNCLITNNGGAGVGTGSSGVNLFGNFNQYNTFTNCTVTGNGNVQYADGQWVCSGSCSPTLTINGDIGNEIIGGTWTGSNGAEPVIINNQPPSFSVIGAIINGPGPASAGGLSVVTSGGCVNSNTFGATTFSSGTRVINASGAVGSGNELNGFSSNLTSGTCGSSVPPLPPTGLTATVQ
jgi:hypothetical protein